MQHQIVQITNIFETGRWFINSARILLGNIHMGPRFSTKILKYWLSIYNVCIAGRVTNILPLFATYRFSKNIFLEQLFHKHNLLAEKKANQKIYKFSQNSNCISQNKINFVNFNVKDQNLFPIRIKVTPISLINCFKFMHPPQNLFPLFPLIFNFSCLFPLHIHRWLCMYI